MLVIMVKSEIFMDQKSVKNGGRKIRKMIEKLKRKLSTKP